LGYTEKIKATPEAWESSFLLDQPKWLISELSCVDQEFYFGEKIDPEFFM